MANVFRKLLGAPESPPYDYGTVAYHRHWAEWWRKQARFQFISPSVGVVFLLIVDNPEVINDILAVFYMFLAGFCGTRWQHARSKADFHQHEAWNVETQETIEGMARSGMYSSPLEVCEAMRDGPPPPGWKREEWIEAGNKAIEDLRKRYDG